MKQELIREEICGARNLGNYISFLVLFGAGMCFFLAGISSYFQKNFLFFTDTSTLTFLPQGITMMFYGTAGLVLSFYIFLTILWNVGSGYNEFSKSDQLVRIVRRGFPGKNQTLFFSYEFQNIESIKFLFKQGLNPRCNILLILKDKREIPLFPPQVFLEPLKIEQKAIEWSRFLNVPMKSLFL
jgi:hypothetical protein